MLIVDDDLLHTLEGDVYNIFDVIKTLVRRCFSSGLLQVKPQVFDAPLTSMTSVEIVLLLLDSVVRQMDHHVVHLTHIRAVVLSAKSGETQATKPNFQRFIAGHQNVDS